MSAIFFFKCSENQYLNGRFSCLGLCNVSAQNNFANL